MTTPDSRVLPPLNLPRLMADWGAHCGQRAYRWVALGSSNTELGWHSDGRHSWPCWLSLIIRANIGMHVQMMNAGIGGTNGQQTIGRLAGDVLEANPHLVVITIGGNDWLQGRPLNVFEENVRTLEARLRAANVPVAFQTYYSPLPEMGPGFPPYMDVVRAVARSTGSALIDQYSWFLPWLQNDLATYKQIMRDPMHLNPIGNALMGLCAGRVFGMTDPELPPDMAPKVQAGLAHLSRWATLPEPVTKEKT